MFLIDITRDDFTSDFLVANDSMSAKKKTIDYIINYVLVNYNINLGEEVIDSYLNIEHFSLNDFLQCLYSITTDRNLLIQGFITDKDHCLFVKHFDMNNTDFPNVYFFDKTQTKQANSTLAYLINESLLNKYEDNLDLYKKNKISILNPNISNIKLDNISSEIISFYKSPSLIDDLLNSMQSYYQLMDKYKGGINI